MGEPLAPLLVLAGILTFVFGWNNSSILIGNQRGSGTLSARGSLAICSIGMILGVVLEGSKMRGSLEGTTTGQVTDAVVVTTMVVSLVLTLGLTIAAIPVSFSNTMVGAFVGAAFASSLAIHTSDIVTIVVFWAVAPLATMVLTFLVYRVIEVTTANWSLLGVDAFNRAGVGVVSLALAYVLSANNIGLIYGTAFSTAVMAGGQEPSSGGGRGLEQTTEIVLALAACAIVGMALFGRGNVAGTVGDRLLTLSPQGVLSAFSGTILLMWVATQLGIPISVSQCLIGGMFGAAYTKRIAIVNSRLSIDVIASWVAIPLAAFALALIFTPLF